MKPSRRLIEGVNAEAIDQVLSYFQPFINSECKREYKDEFGRVHYVADEYMQRRDGDKADYKNSGF